MMGGFSLRWIPDGQATCTVYEDQTPILDVVPAGQRRRAITIMPSSPYRVTYDELAAACSLLEALVEFVAACQPWTTAETADATAAIEAATAGGAS